MTTEALKRRDDRFRQAAMPFDVVVVGGGCNGAAIAWDAALRGLRTLLLEKEDFGWATSAWNSRLIHGGLKYLEKYDVRLVRESLREREWMLHAAPHLVRPRQFVLPFFTRNAHPAAVLRLGMVAYDALSWDKSTPRHRTHGPAAALGLVPGLNTDGLQGAATYFDGQVDYAERLSLEIALAAEAAGAIVLNHAEVDRVLVKDGAVAGVEFRDTVAGDRHTARAAAVVNAAGPWVDEVLASAEERVGRPLMGGTKGTHLIVDPFPGAPVDSAMYYEALTDARPMMVIPWLGRYIIGATDVRFTGDLDTASSDDDELDYILRETNLVLPGANLGREDILWSYTGVRPLPYQESGPTSDITRRHQVHHHEDDARPVRGLFSVIGGKLTTFRAVAEHTNDDVLGKTVRGRRGRGKRSTTRTARFPGAQALDFEDFARRFVGDSDLPEDVATRLVGLYGTRATAVQALAQAEPGLAKRIDGAPRVIAAEIAFALRAESAVTLSDIVARRIMTGLDGTMGRESLNAVGEVAARLAGWSDAQLADETQAYLRYLAKFHPREL
jgi:glycerol-3-phosphate dehydrogenase